METDVLIKTKVENKPIDYLDTKFYHKNWFINGISKKLALQYFASTGDFIFNGSRILYTGREGGTYNLSKKEQMYYENLLKQVKDAKNYGLKYLKESNFTKNDKVSFAFKNLIVTVNFDWVYVNFKEYLQSLECGKYYKELTTSNEFKNIN